MNKSLLTLVIIALLPFGAMAEYTYNYIRQPARVEDGDVLTMAQAGYYQTVEINNDDANHIASTAYVKGAYNDTIAALNVKQDVLYEEGEGDPIQTNVFGSSDFVGDLIYNDSDMAERWRNSLVSAAAVKAGIQSQRVEVYTNWDNDNATTDVAFKTVMPED